MTGSEGYKMPGCIKTNFEIKIIIWICPLDFLPLKSLEGTFKLPL